MDSPLDFPAIQSTKITVSQPGVMKFLDVPQMHLMDLGQAGVPIWHLEEVAAAATWAAMETRWSSSKQYACTECTHLFGNASVTTVDAGTET